MVFFSSQYRGCTIRLRCETPVPAAHRGRVDLPQFCAERGTHLNRSDLVAVFTGASEVDYNRVLDEVRIPAVDSHCPDGSDSCDVSTKVTADECCLYMYETERYSNGQLG